MRERESEEENSSLSLNEVLFILFKHKRKIIFCACTGILAAAVVYFLVRPVYMSQAKLFVPYVVDRTPVDPTNETIATSRANDAIMNSEVEILTSWDLVVETASNIQYKGIADGPTTDAIEAEGIRDIVKRIEVVAAKGMNVITVSYKDSDPERANRFLQQLLKNYRERHLKIHRFPEALDVIAQRRDEVRMQLEKTEAELKRMKEEGQILSVADSASSLSAAIAKSQEELNKAEAERRGQESRVQELEKLLRGEATNVEEPSGVRASNVDAERYRSLVEQLSLLREKESTLLLTYPADSRMVKIPRKQIYDLEEQRRALEAKYPYLAATATSSGASQPQQPDLISEKARLAAITASTEVLKAQLQDLQSRRERFSALAPQIVQLDRDKELLELNYKNIETSLGKAKDDKAVDWSKIPNIASVQEPSPAMEVPDPLKKKLAPGLAVGGLVFGLGLAFLLETKLDRTVKRPFELEQRLRIPVLLSIPFIKASGRISGDHRSDGREPRALLGPNGAASVAPWAVDHFIRPFCEAIRDRMILSFELRNLCRKPKLIGVTGFSRGAGSSTLAGGLAAALSETGDGKVLLVDMNLRDGKAHPIFEGKTTLSLGSLLQTEGPLPSTAGNLYLAAVEVPNSRRMPIGLRLFNSLIPSLKDADFEYIIFDMPPLGTTSPSLSMACFMDKVLLVLEAEQSDRGMVKRFYSELIDSEANVSCVFNKTRSYAPSWLEGEG